MITMRVTPNAVVFEIGTSSGAPQLVHFPRNADYGFFKGTNDRDHVGQHGVHADDAGDREGVSVRDLGGSLRQVGGERLGTTLVNSDEVISDITRRVIDLL